MSSPSKSIKLSTKSSAAVVLSQKLAAGAIYRREDLALVSKAIDRHLKQLQEIHKLKKLSQGLYYVPRQSAYGPLPPDDRALVTKFLRDRDFLIFSPASYNTLELGSTQLYNRTVVYNHKRHGIFTFGNRTFNFRVKPRFPQNISIEFLFVDLLNNLDEFAEEQDVIMLRARSKFREFNCNKLKQTVSKYGSASTKKLIRGWLESSRL